MKNFDMASFYSLFLENIRDAQGIDGSMTDFVPFCGEFPKDDRKIVCNQAWTRLKTNEINKVQEVKLKMKIILKFSISIRCFYSNKNSIDHIFWFSDYNQTSRSSLGYGLSSYSLVHVYRIWRLSAHCRSLPKY